MGNTVVMKMPRTGVLCHWPTLPLFRDCFPPGVVNIISGSGRTQVTPISMRQSSCFTLGSSKASYHVFLTFGAAWSYHEERAHRHFFSDRHHECRQRSSVIPPSSPSPARLPWSRGQEPSIHTPRCQRFLCSCGD